MKESLEDYCVCFCVVLFFKNQLPEVFCVMRLSPSFPRIKVDYIFTLLSKYATGIKHAVEINSSQNHQTETTHGEDDDTNQSVSSIEDDFVTAFEHLDEDESSKILSTGKLLHTCRNWYLKFRLLGFNKNVSINKL